ncbi:MAG: transposase [candidate division NC10 bacterium]|nr:transposase [candidate division NC10 bacterium]
MPRHARLDAPGALHHVICRGIERRPINRDDTDRAAFVGQLGRVLTATGTPCYAWALLSNHVHLLLRTGAVPLTTVMRRLLTGYASAFNRRHRRHGYLFQNRYKSILCQDEPYLLELVRYLHLNPLRAGLVKDLRALDCYPWSGHSALVGQTSRPWQAVSEVLAHFSARAAVARRAYRDFVADGIPQGRRPELTGGGLVRSAGGWAALTERRRLGNRLHGDERILGESEFVEAALKAGGEVMEWRHQLLSHGYDFDWLLRRVAADAGVPAADLLTPSKVRRRARYRSILCYWAVRKLGLPGTVVAARLGLTQPAVSRAVLRGERVVKEQGLVFPQG